MSVYLSPIAMGILVSLLIIYAALFPVMIYQYRKYGSLQIRKNIVLFSFILYSITALFMTILPLPSIESVVQRNSIQPNFIPFTFVLTFLNESGFKLFNPLTWLPALRSSSFFTVAFNVLLTLPLGVYARKYFKLNLLNTILLGLGVSLFYEITQFTGLYGLYPKAYRMADVDDHLTNTAGAALGFAFTGLLSPILPNTDKDVKNLSDTVTLWRRISAFLIDSFICSFLFGAADFLFSIVKGKSSAYPVSYIVCEILFIIIFPLVINQKRTIGMIVLKIKFVSNDQKEISIKNYIHYSYLYLLWFHAMNVSNENVLWSSYDELLSDTLLLIWFIPFIILSIKNKQWTYYWETWCGVKMKAEKKR